MKKWISVTALALMLSPLGASASTPEMDALKGLVDSKIRAWSQDPAIVSAVKAQNDKHSGVTQADIDKMDKQWRAETSASSQPMVDAVLANELSNFLAGVKDQGEGLFTEIFVMDNKGLNVGQSDVTSDYWQGDEAKWKETYLKGADAVHISEIEQDESTQMFQSQISVSVVDPGTNQVIGAVTVGINVDEALQ